ncbi:MAG: hypothetical protein HC886_05830 [Leptolyngbyaceae cyanobacterium SM1_1_3]|nr:hypothetical protein [Leptolyngbyaceae cyanobacterium SM1_1_3]NJN05016.1 hypothetical protein [Leptolyngbyaceae cyanobacterium RM1_1_2]NJO09588.1 hypothetical protein [Leptolyngbyaceae cyanobacterium SL_1_1]
MKSASFLTNALTSVGVALILPLIAAPAEAASDVHPASDRYQRSDYQCQ